MTRLYGTACPDQGRGGGSSAAAAGGKESQASLPSGLCSGQTLHCNPHEPESPQPLHSGLRRTGAGRGPSSSARGRAARGLQGRRDTSMATGV